MMANDALSQLDLHSSAGSRGRGRELGGGRVVTTLCPRACALRQANWVSKHILQQPVVCAGLSEGSPVEFRISGAPTREAGVRK